MLGQQFATETMVKGAALANFESKLYQEYRSARLKAYVKRVFNRLITRRDKLKELCQKWADSLPGQVDLGLQDVSLAKITGTLGRSHDFGSDFLPHRSHNRDRWLNINRLYHQNTPLPPVELYQVEDEYFVVDGHHRVSVTRFHGQQFIEAHVIRLNLA